MAPRHRGDDLRRRSPASPSTSATAVCMALVHDIVEIDAGDTFAYDTAPRPPTARRLARMAAADRLFGLLPPAMGARFRALWDEYERGDTPEARYVMAVDRMAPMLLNTGRGRQHLARVRHHPRRVSSTATARTSSLRCPQVWAAALGRPRRSRRRRRRRPGLTVRCSTAMARRKVAARTSSSAPAHGLRAVNLDREEIDLIVRLVAELRALMLSDDPNTAPLTAPPVPARLSPGRRRRGRGRVPAADARGPGRLAAGGACNQVDDRARRRATPLDRGQRCRACCSR